MIHSWEHCDLNPNIADPEGRGRHKNAHQERKKYKGNKDSSAQTNAQNWAKESVEMSSKAASDTIVPMLAHIPALVNGSDSSNTSKQPIKPKNVIDSGASETYLTLNKILSSMKPQQSTLQTATGALSFTPHSRKLKVTNGSAPPLYQLNE